MKDFNSFINESSLSRVWQHFQNHDAGAITAMRGEYSNSQNKARNRKLVSDLRAMRYGVTKIKGSYIENMGTDNEQTVKEASFLVVDVNDTGKLQKDLERLGKKYEQDSILFSKAGTPRGDLIGTKEGQWPGLGKKASVGTAVFGKSGEFTSKVNGRPFIFEAVKQAYSVYSASSKEHHLLMHDPKKPNESLTLAKFQSKSLALKAMTMLMAGKTIWEVHKALYGKSGTEFDELFYGKEFLKAKREQSAKDWLFYLERRRKQQEMERRKEAEARKTKSSPSLFGVMGT